MAKQLNVRDPEGLNLRFYETYDEKYLLRKAEILLFIAKHADAFRGFAEQHEWTPESIDRRALRAEVHFTELHQSEAFFALLTAIFQTKPHWVYLTEYKPGAMKKKAEAYLKGDIAAVTNGRIDKLNDFLNSAIYDGFIVSDEEKARDWQTNLDNIDWMIRRIARKYVKGEEYNAYKHGLRFVAEPSFIRFTLTDHPDRGFEFSSDDSLTFLELTPTEGSVNEGRLSHQSFDPEQSILHLDFMSGVLVVHPAKRLPFRVAAR